MAGKIHCIVGTSPGGFPDIGTVTFAVAFAAAPFVVVMPASASASGNYKPWAASVSTTGFTISPGAGGTTGGAGALLDFYYMVIG
jgi:hypothetical protein